MKRENLSLKILALLFILFASCEEILDKNPPSSYSDPVVWSDINLAKTYLTRAYNQIDYGMNKGEMLGSMADELIIARGDVNSAYHQGTISGDNLSSNRGHLAWPQYSNIQRVNLFLDNIDKVAESYSGAEKVVVEEQAKVLKGEALFLRAWIYHVLLRSYGGVPILDKSFTLGDDYLNIGRATFEETVNFIVSDCNAAAGLLKLKSQMEMGRATRESALALKSRVLLFAASDLTADGTAANSLVGYSNPNRTALWTAARDAAKAVIDLGTVKLSDFGAPDKKAVAENYFAMFKAYNLADDEIIWGRMFRPDVGTTHSQNRTCGPNGISNFGRNGPLQSMVDSYQMEDGSSFFDHFEVVNGRYVNKSTKYTYENPYYHRDPRFYASVLYDSAVWQPRFPNLAEIDPLGIYDRRTRIVISGGKVVSERFGLDTRQGPVDNWNGTQVGYLLKKFMDDQTNGRDGNNQNVWIHMRYAEVLLNYAEALLELGDAQTASQYINMIRNRSAMPNFTGDVRTALRQERKIELFGEDIRWFDVRRWKILDQALAGTPWGIDILEVTTDGVKETTWIRRRAQPDSKFHPKLYWIPIETAELRRAPKLEQNPGY